MKKYMYRRLENIEKYEGWKIEKIIERDNRADYHMVVLSKEEEICEDSPKLKDATNEQLMEELFRRVK